MGTCFEIGFAIMIRFAASWRRNCPARDSWMTRLAERWPVPRSGVLAKFKFVTSETVPISMILYSMP